MSINTMDIDEWKEAYFKELAETDWNKAYFMQTDRKAREDLLKKRIAKGEESAELELIQKLYDHRYIPTGNEPRHIDHAIRGLVNMVFLPETKKSFIKRRRYEKELKAVINDLGIPLAEPYGKEGQTVMYDEMCNIVRKYIQLCREDKQYNAVLFGFGRIKPKTQSRKIANSVVSVAVLVPKATGTEKEFEMLTAAARQVFPEEFPKTAEDFDIAASSAESKI